MESDAEMAARLQMEEMRREAGLHGRGGMGGGRRLGGGGQRRRKGRAGYGGDLDPMNFVIDRMANDKFDNVFPASLFDDTDLS